MNGASPEVLDALAVGLRESLSWSSEFTLPKPGTDWAATADEVIARAFTDNRTGARTLVFWCGRWLLWTGSYWAAFTDDDRLDDLIRGCLERAVWLKPPHGDRALWCPNRTRVTETREAIRRRVRVADSLKPGEWIKRPDGAEDWATVACAESYIENDLSRESVYGGGAWHPYIADPRLFALSALAVQYDPTAEVPEEWLELLDYVFDGDREGIALLQEWAGYLVSGRTDQQVGLQLLGPPGSGKGTITRVIGSLYGQALTAASLDTLGSRFGLDNALNAPVLSLADARGDGGKSVSPVTVERLLSIIGEDSIRTEEKFKTGQTVKLPCRIMVAANKALTLPDDSGAFDRRWLFLRTMQSFGATQDSAKEAPLHTPWALQGILNWALEGLDRLNLQAHERGTGRAAFTVQEAAHGDREIALALGSELRQFIDQHYRPAPGVRSVMLADFHGRYLTWRSSGTSHWQQFQKQTEADLRSVGFEVIRPKSEDDPARRYRIVGLEAIHEPAAV